MAASQRCAAGVRDGEGGAVSARAGNVNATPAGNLPWRDVAAVTEMEEFDRLPRLLRDRLNYAPANFSAESVGELFRKKGEFETAMDFDYSVRQWRRVAT